MGNKFVMAEDKAHRRSRLVYISRRIENVDVPTWMTNSIQR
jgi:hypothetical protein